MSKVFGFRIFEIDEDGNVSDFIDEFEAEDAVECMKFCMSVPESDGRRVVGAFILPKEVESASKELVSPYFKLLGEGSLLPWVD